MLRLNIYSFSLVFLLLLCIPKLTFAQLRIYVSEGTLTVGLENVFEDTESISTLSGKENKLPLLSSYFESSMEKARRAQKTEEVGQKLVLFNTKTEKRKLQAKYSRHLPFPSSPFGGGVKWGDAVVVSSTSLEQNLKKQHKDRSLSQRFLYLSISLGSLHKGCNGKLFIVPNTFGLSKHITRPPPFVLC